MKKLEKLHKVRKVRKFALTAVQINPKIYQHFNKQMKDDDESFEIAFNLNEKMVGCASERLRRKHLSNINEVSN